MPDGTAELASSILELSEFSFGVLYIAGTKIHDNDSTMEIRDRS